MAKPTEFRSDGWPLCPVCGEDKLACLNVDDVTLLALGHALFCYRCGRYTVEAEEAQQCRPCTSKS